MTDAAPIPTSGYRIHRIYSVRQSQELVTVVPGEVLPNARDVTFAWDWRILDPQFEVLLGLTIGPDATSSERLAYHVVGSFELSEEAPSVPLEQFVVRNAIATLLPFVREGLAQLSSRGPFETYYLPQINATTLAERFNYAAATGSNQFELFPEFETRMRRAMQAAAPHQESLLISRSDQERDDQDFIDSISTSGSA